MDDSEKMKKYVPGAMVRVANCTVRLWSGNPEGPQLGEICQIREVRGGDFYLKLEGYRYTDSDSFIPWKYLEPLQLKVSFRDIMNPTHEWI
jgi:hypothetical protein